MTKPELYTEITLTRDIPEHALKSGDIATVVDYVQHPQGGEDGCILEVFNVLGESICRDHGPHLRDRAAACGSDSLRADLRTLGVTHHQRQPLAELTPVGGASCGVVRV